MKKFKKMFLSTAALLVIVSIFCFNAFAATIGTVRVSTSLNIRQSASTSAPIIGRLYNGTNVYITGSSNGWYQINRNGLVGWVSASYVSTSTTTASKIDKALDTAESALGVRYVYGGASMNGFDCSGLTQYAYAAAGVTLPHSSSMQSQMGVAVSRAALQPGDLIFFDTTGSHSAVNHVGIYLGNGQFINAQSGLGKVAVASLSVSYWSNSYLFAKRIVY